MGGACFFIGHRDTGAEIFPALSDARSILSIAISHNMDNVDEIDQDALNKYFGLDTNGKDASGSKSMTKTQGASTIVYTYTRGGVIIEGTINYAEQKTTWKVSGMGTTRDTNNNRQSAIAEGLKVNPDDGTVITFA